MEIFRSQIPNTETRLSLSQQVTDIALGNLVSISLTHSFSVTPANIAIIYRDKLHLLAYISIAKSINVSSGDGFLNCAVSDEKYKIPVKYHHHHHHHGNF